MKYEIIKISSITLREEVSVVRRMVNMAGTTWLHNILKSNQTPGRSKMVNTYRNKSSYHYVAGQGFVTIKHPGRSDSERLIVAEKLLTVKSLQSWIEDYIKCFGINSIAWILENEIKSPDFELTIIGRKDNNGTTKI